MPSSRDPESGGGGVLLKSPDGERAEEALALARIAYGEFLERCEPIIRHGVSEAAQRDMADYFEDRKLTENAREEPRTSS